MPACSLLAAPVEVLHLILQYVPDQKNTTVWRSASLDVSMLLPISQTCRRLRDITVCHPTLSANIGVYPKLRTLARNAIAGSGIRPLSADLVLTSYSDPGWEDMKSLWPKVAPTLRVLRVVLKKSNTAEYNWDPAFECPYPRLESFSLRDDTQYRSYIPFPSFAQGHVSGLRILELQSVTVLPTCEFPQLAHLALQDVRVRPENIIELLSRCPSLESLILHRILPRPVLPVQHLPPDLSLPHLRRVVLKDLLYEFLAFFLQRIPRHSHGYSWQIFGSPRFYDAGALLLDHSIGPVRTIHISAGPSDEWLEETRPTYRKLSVAFLSSRSVVRVWSAARRSGATSPRLLWHEHSAEDKAALRSVSDVWVVNFPGGGDWWDNFAVPLRASIAALPSLEVVSLVMDQFQDHCEDLELADLRVLPDGRDPAFDSPLLKTVRLVYGYDREMEYRRIIDAGRYGELLKPRETKQLRLSRVVEQLKTGAYDYLDRLVVRVASSFTIDEAELVQLRGYVPQLDVEYSDERPDSMPLPEYAREPEASGCLHHWDGLFY